MKKAHRNAQKLTLNRETLRVLDELRLRTPVGGITQTYCSEICTVTANYTSCETSQDGNCGHPTSTTALC